MASEKFLIFDDEDTLIAKKVDLASPNKVVSRKLFVGRIIEAKHQTVEGLSSLFSKFGDIEKIEIFPEKFPADEYPNECYAYITFVGFKAAADAYEAHNIMFKESLLRVVPVDTWKQPDAANEQDQYELDETVLQELNDHCLLQVFGFCDLKTLKNLSKVSVRFSTLIQQHVYPTHEKFDMDYDSAVTTFRENMQNIGPYIVDATIGIREYFNGFFTETFKTRLLDIFSKYGGPKIERLTIKSFDPSNRMQKQFGTIFSQLKRLEWKVDGHPRYKMYLPQLCPQLEELEIDNSAENDRNVTDIGFQEWPTLKRLHLKHSTFKPFFMPTWPARDASFYDGRFITNNPQLTELTLDTWGHSLDDFVRDASQSLFHLEVLTLCYERSFFTSKTILRSLGQLRKLKKFSLTNYGAETDPYTVLEMLSHLQPNSTQLTVEITLSYCEDEIDRDNEDGGEPAVIHLPHLQHFKLVGYPLSEEKFMEIIEMAPPLREFALGYPWIQMKITESLLMRIVDIRTQQARLNGTPVVRLKLVLYGFGDCVGNERFKMDESIMEKIDGIRNLQDSEDVVLLPFYEDDNRPPYCKLIAELISIEARYDA